MPIPLTVNGLPVTSAEITEPRWGAWIADLVVDAETAETLDGQVTIASEDGAVAFVGTRYRGGSFASETRVRVTGGAGGLATVIPPKFYRSQPIRVIATEILEAAGETLAASSSAAVLDVTLASWSRLSGPAADALGAVLAQVPGAVWRTLRDGSIWVGIDDYPAIETEDERLDEDAAEGTAALIGERPDLRPATTYLGRRVSDVVHSYGEDETRTIVYFEDPSSAGRPGGRALGALLGIIRAATSGSSYLAPRLGTVIRQAAGENGSLEVRFRDDRGVPDLVAVPLLHGVHGVAQKVARGAQVVLGFLSNNGQKPFALGWLEGTPLETTIDAATKLRLGAQATRGAARLNDTVGAGSIALVFTPGAPPAIPPTTTLIYTDANGVPGTPMLLPLLHVHPGPLPLVVSFPLGGKITSASSLVDIE